MDLSLVIALCRQFEGLYLKPYYCPAHVATIGIGSTRYPDGRPVQITDPEITEDQAIEFMQAELQRVCLPGVIRLCPVLLNHNAKLNAVVDFAYNCGVGALQTSTLRRKINEESWDEAADQFGRWTKGGGRVLPGLVRRRAAEAELFRS